MLYTLGLSLYFIVCLVWAVILLRRWKHNCSAQNLMGIALLVAAIGGYSYVNYFLIGERFADIYWSYVVNSITAPLFLALLVRYFRLLTNYKKLKWWNNILFLPVVLMGCLLLVTFLMYSDSLTIMLNNNDFSDSFVVFVSPEEEVARWLYYNQIILTCVLLMQGLFVILYAFRAMYKYSKELNNYYTNESATRVRLSYNVILSVIGWVSMGFFTNLMPYIESSTFSSTVRLVQMLCFAIVGYVMAYSIYSLPYTIKDLVILQEKMDSENQTCDDDCCANGGEQSLMQDSSVSSRLLMEFNILMDSEKIFLKPDLRLDDITRALSTNRTYISKMINVEFGVSFSDFINAKRVDCAKEMMLSSVDMPLEDIAERCGFLSTSSFYRHFKNKTELTPNQWRKNNVIING